MLRLIALAALSVLMPYRRTDSQGYRLRFTGSIRGTRIADERGERWRGTLRMKVLVTRRGHYVETCRTGKLRFTLRQA